MPLARRHDRRHQVTVQHLVILGEIVHLRIRCLILSSRTYTTAILLVNRVQIRVVFLHVETLGEDYLVDAVEGRLVRHEDLDQVSFVLRREVNILDALVDEAV